MNMRKFISDTYGSIAPIVIFLIVLALVGLIGGILDVFIQIARTSATATVPGVSIPAVTDMDILMSSAWYFVFFIIFIVLASWVHMVAQKRQFG